MTIFSPFVYWAQDEKSIFLKIDLKDVKDPDISVEEKQIYFQSKGTGAQGLTNYEFLIDLHSELNTNSKNVKITDHKIDITLTKEQKGFWPRLTSRPQKPAWLKIDFDKWKSEDDLLEEKVGNVLKDYPDLYDQLQKEELGYRKEDFKKVYLTFYNLFMFIGFMYITCVLCLKYTRDGPDFFPVVYEHVGRVVCVMQLLQCLEILHPLFGYVKGGMFLPFVQIVGRLFVLFLNVEKEPRIQKMPVVFYLFLSWSAIEIIRYPYYMTQLYKKENKLLTWIRYSAWIILYPVGFICEGVILFRNLIFVDQSGKWSISLPNSLNFTFHYSTFLRIYLLFVMIPGMFTLIRHMHKIRQQKLGSKNKKSKSKRL
ncbi:3-hydroxyacyl-CoA dehydratase 2 [Leptinotarsa decemlineata]|uniref:3-hydroxyacyl-CoA dehydratase 2 n=1 Tax=Leptinotarsa decemlineata TaxID=7539 RepID=UPI003D305D5B